MLGLHSDSIFVVCLNCKFSLAFVLQPEDLFVCDSDGNDVTTPPPRLVEAYLDCQIACQTQGG